jgi:hypothetical protein
MEHKAEDDIKFDKNDISAVANSRFFRKAGLRILLGWALVLFIVTALYNFLNIMPSALAYILISVSSIVAVYLYGKKQTEVRVKLWENIERNRQEKHNAKE